MQPVSLWNERDKLGSLYRRDLTPVPAFTLFAKLNSCWFDLCHFEYFFISPSSPHSSVTGDQTCKYSSWPRIAWQPREIIPQPHRGAEKLCRKIPRERVTVGKFLLTSFSYLSLWQWVQSRGWQRERERASGLVCLPCVLERGCDHDWQWRDNSEGQGRQGQRQELRC